MILIWSQVGFVKKKNGCHLAPRLTVVKGRSNVAPVFPRHSPHRSMKSVLRAIGAFLCQPEMTNLKEEEIVTKCSVGMVPADTVLGVEQSHLVPACSLAVPPYEVTPWSGAVRIFDRALVFGLPETGVVRSCVHSSQRRPACPYIRASQVVARCPRRSRQESRKRRPTSDLRYLQREIYVRDRPGQSTSLFGDVLLCL